MSQPIRFFFDENWMKERLLDYRFDYPKPDKFIDYQSNAKEYDDERKTFTFLLDGEKRSFSIPFVEVINYYRLSGRVRIEVDGPIVPYVMPAWLVKLTDENLESFLKEKPNTTDGPVLRIARLTQASEFRYTCKLEVACYRHQVRTNLTVDYKLRSDRTMTLRTMDFGDKEDNDLPDFHESNLINSIGVSSIIYYQHPKDGKLYYFLLPRKANLGVYGKMLAAVGGVVEPPNYNPESNMCSRKQEPDETEMTSIKANIDKGLRLCDPMEELTEYAIEEIKREVILELGLLPEHLDPENGFKITPLAFVRELVRGGKPEFFFSIQIPYIRDAVFQHCIKNSIEGKEEFIIKFYEELDGRAPYISPQMMSIFAYELDRRQKNARIKV